MTCRSCDICVENYTTALHYEVDKDFKCLFCGIHNKCIYHGETEEVIGISYECIKCNNYIVYYDKDNLLKDEIYFDEFYLIRDFETNDSYLVRNDESVGSSLPMITEFENVQELREKLDVFLTFL